MRQRDSEIKASAAPAAEPWQNQVRHIRHSHLARRLLGAILLVSSLGALLATFTELALDYRYEVEQVHQDMDALQKTTAGTLAYNLWIVNPQALQRQIADLLRLPSVRYVEIVENDGTRYQGGHPVLPQRDRVERVFKLEYVHPISGSTVLMGTVRIEASTAEIKSRLFDRFLVIFCTQGLKTFLVSFFILAFFQWLVTRHLRSITQQARRINYLNLRQPLTVDRVHEDDEINELVDAFNQMRRNLLRDIELWEHNEKALMAENALAQSTLNMLPEITLRTDSRSQVTWINRLGEHLIRHGEMPLNGRLLGEVLPAAKGFANVSAERLFLDAQNSAIVMRRRIVFRHGAGRIFGAEASAVLLRDADQQSVGMILMLRELSEIGHDITD
ncbi:MAG: HAMP domain-containing protein [Moraxellaceae bacterium]